MPSVSAGRPGLIAGPGRGTGAPEGGKPEGQTSILAGDAASCPQLAASLVAGLVARAPAAGVQGVYVKVPKYLVEKMVERSPDIR